MVKSDGTQVGPTVTGYLCFCRTFSVVIAPLSRLCSPAIPFLYGLRCVNVLFLKSSNFSQPSSLRLMPLCQGRVLCCCKLAKVV